MTDLRGDPPFDPRWLDLVAATAADLGRGLPQLVDLFLERRLDLHVWNGPGGVRVDEVRSEGTAIRWTRAGRTTLHARTGVSPLVVTELLRRRTPDVAMACVRSVPPPELDPPRGLADWALELLGRIGRRPASVRYLQRQAVVLRPGAWRTATTPSVVRVELDHGRGGALLAIWPHPRLGQWLTELLAPDPGRSWRPASGSTSPVVLANGTAGVLLHELVGHLVEADLVRSGESPLGDLGGATLTASSVTIDDDPTRSDLPGAFDCDDEGVPAASRRLVEDGRLVGFLGDRASEHQSGIPAGRARRAGWDRPPLPRMSNLLVQAGVTPAQDLERAAGAGLVVTRLTGASVDPVSAQVLLQVERGFELSHGRRRRPLAPLRLTGGVLEVLAAIDPPLGDDPTPDWRLGWCVKLGGPLPTGSLAPTMMVRAMRVV